MKKCKACNAQTKVTDTRTVEIAGQALTQRRRQCLQCGEKFKTYEVESILISDMLDITASLNRLKEIAELISRKAELLSTDSVTISGAISRLELVKAEAGVITSDGETSALESGTAAAAQKAADFELDAKKAISEAFLTVDEAGVVAEALLHRSEPKPIIGGADDYTTPEKEGDVFDEVEISKYLDALSNDPKADPAETRESRLKAAMAKNEAAKKGNPRIVEDPDWTVNQAGRVVYKPVIDYKD